MSFERKVVNFEIKQNMDWILTGGDDILYLITLRNLEIQLVISLCRFEVCFGTQLLTGLQWHPSPQEYWVIPISCCEGKASFQVCRPTVGYQRDCDKKAIYVLWKTIYEGMQPHLCPPHVYWQVLNLLLAGELNTFDMFTQILPDHQKQYSTCGSTVKLVMIAWF